MNIYRICFKNGATVDVRATKLESGRIFTKSSLVVTKEDGSVDEQAYFPIDEILYVLPLEMISFDHVISRESSEEMLDRNPILDS